MRALVLAALTLFMVGCKGPQGEKGMPGEPGTRGLTGPLGPTGPTQMVLVSATVTGNDFAITDPHLATATGVIVYNAAGGSTTSLPYFLPSSGLNTYYLWTPGASKVEVFNAQLAGATQTIVAIILG